MSSLQHLNLSINYLKVVDYNDLIYDNISAEVEELLRKYFSDNSELSEEERVETFNQIIETTREQLKKTTTVGDILDIMKFSVKMLIVEKGGGYSSNEVLLLNEIFLRLPQQWTQDPVKVHLCTKVIYQEALQGDFENTVYVLNNIISINQLGFYVGLTLFWALLFSFFKKDSHHYYKMYDRSKFFKLLQMSESKDIEMDFQSILQLLVLISIYQNYVLFNKETANECHEVFSDCFKHSSSAKDDVEKLRKYLKNLKTRIEEANSSSGEKNADALTLLEFLELELIKAISETS